MSAATFFSRLPRPRRRVQPILIPVAVLLALLGLHFHLQRGGWFSAVSNQPIKKPPAAGIVVASLRHEDTSWIHRHLPDWSHSIYIVDDPSAELTVPKNKGREAMVYLRYVKKQNQP
jgi:hypothetical protein